MGFISAFIIVVFFAISTEKYDRIILIPDSDGKVGEIVVSHPSGTHQIKQAYSAVHIKGKSTIHAPKQLEKEAVHSSFAEVISAMPQASSRYILYFNSATTKLTDESKLLINQIVEDVKSRTYYDVFIDGHTDTTGSAEKNYLLALKRAQEVSNLFGDKLPKPEKVKVSSHGEGNLLIKTADNVGEARNRRVEIVIH
jgi:peptidoglycan-associated lipoprotein